VEGVDIMSESFVTIDELDLEQIHDYDFVATVKNVKLYAELYELYCSARVVFPSIVPCTLII
jgi:hypothetical protein